MSTEQVVTLHAKLSPSASDRWLNCSVAPSREASVPDKSSGAAAEGTAAHAMAEYCLRKKIDAKDAPAHRDWDQYDSATCRAFVQEYLDCVRSKVSGGELFIEQRLDIFPEYGVFGTADAVIVDHGVLKIIDLKFGTGLVVDAEDNTQLRMYAWGGLQSLDWLSDVPIDRVEVTIKQPRRGHESTETFDADTLRAWAAENEPKVAAAYRGEGQANPGAHCKWCRVRATCKERAADAISIAGMDFSVASAPCDVEGLTEAELVTIFLKIPLLEAYIKSVETHLADIAHERKVEGLKWVEGRATRTINNPIAASQTLRGIGVEPLSEPALLGITELEKRCKAKGVKLGEVLKDYISMKHGQPVLVGVADKRNEYVQTAGAVEDFA